MTVRLDKDKIARVLGAERRGQVVAKSGYFGAIQLLEEIRARFQVPTGGGRATDPTWSERRLLPLRPKTLERLEELTIALRNHTDIGIGPMQLAAMLLEHAIEELTEDEAALLLHSLDG